MNIRNKYRIAAASVAGLAIVVGGALLVRDTDRVTNFEPQAPRGYAEVFSDARAADAVSGSKVVNAAYMENLVADFEAHPRPIKLTYGEGSANEVFTQQYEVRVGHFTEKNGQKIAIAAMFKDGKPVGTAHAYKHDEDVSQEEILQALNAPSKPTPAVMTQSETLGK